MLSRYHRDSLLLLAWLIIPGIIQAQDDWHFKGDNIASGKTTDQVPGTWNNQPSSNAVNGDANTCSHTEGTDDTKLSWSVDLKERYIIKGIRIYNTIDAYTKYRVRIRNFTITGYPGETIVYDDSKAQPEQYTQRVITVPVTDMTQFSNITLMVPAGSVNIADTLKYINICEVEIYSVANLCGFPQTGLYMNWALRPGTGYVYTKNGRVASDSVIDFTCDTNYNLTGKSSSTCLSDGSYSDNVPVCVEIRCESPSSFDNGDYMQALAETYAVGETIQWDCSAGYKSDQDKTRKCLVDATWSGGDPVCELITCPYPGDVDRGTLIFGNKSDYIAGHVRSKTSVSVMCDEGYRPNAPSIMCLLNESWSASPSCIQITCERLQQLPGGNITYTLDNVMVTDTNQTYVYGSVAGCNEGFTAVGTEKKCSGDGVWQGDHRCVRHTNPEDAAGQSTYPTTAVTAAIACGTFVFGNITGYLAAILLTKWRKGKAKPPPARDAIYCTPTISATEDTHNYEQLHVATAI